jgi:GntR family transcriptional regulator, transcriptional repressor for pyruvate dehydrogenase complex
MRSTGSPLDIDPFGELDRNVSEPLGARVVARNVADQIVERLVTAVALGVYVPGQRLPTERELSEMLGVSRTGVREALHRMAEAGYLEVRRGRNGGSFVLSGWGPGSSTMIGRHLLPNWERFEALFDARRLIEPLIARTAAERRTRDDVRKIREALDLYSEAADREASRSADELLHRSVGEATHNPVLVSLSTQIRSRVSLNLGAEPYTEEVRHTAAHQHRELTDAIDAGDGDLAARIAAEHFVLTEKLIRDLVHRVRSDGGTS